MFADRQIFDQQLKHGGSMRTILKAGVLVLTLTAIAVSAQGGKLENGAIRATPEGVETAPGAASRVDVPSADPIGEVLTFLQTFLLR